MTRKGYVAEYEVKKILQKQFGTNNVIKVAIGSFGSDYIVVGKGEIIKCVEVKECHKKKYYPSEKELSQFKRIKTFCDEHQITGEVWVRYLRKPLEISRIEDYIKSKEKHGTNKNKQL